MSQVLNVELSEEVFAAIQRQAKSAGISPAHWSLICWKTNIASRLR
jgi:hypothetical protein